MSPVQKGGAAGCNITKDDGPIVIASITCASAYTIYGACYSALSAALPPLANHLDMSTSDFGFAYTTRGVGYLFGTLVAAYILNLPNFSTSKSFLTCLSLLLSGLTMILIAYANNFTVMLVLFAVQGVGFGGIDMLANCALPELWGLRAQPWMQAMHTGFGIGAILGPAMVGVIGYKSSFIIITFLCLLPIGLFSLAVIWERQQVVKNRGFSLSDSTHSQQNAATISNNVIGTRGRGGTITTLLLGVEQSNNNNNIAGGGDANTTLSRSHPATVSHGKILTPSEKSQNYASYKNSALSRSRSAAQNSNIEHSRISNGPMSLKLTLTAAESEDNNGDENSSFADEKPVFLVPKSIKYLTCGFYFIYMGFAAGYSSWITTYALNVNVTSSDAAAAYLVSIYWIAMTVGRLLAIFIAMRVSGTFMIRSKLVQCIAAAVLLLLVADTTYLNLAIATAFMGFAVSSIFPLAMTVVQDYGFTMDASATTLFMVGTTTGDSILPVAIGFIMSSTGDASFLYTMAACCGGLVALYVAINCLGRDQSYFDPINAVSSSTNNTTTTNNNNNDANGDGDDNRA